MKTQRRHQLESNKLAEWLTKNAEQYKSHARTVGIVVVGSIAVFFAALIYRSTRASADGAAWRSFYNAFTTERSSPEALIEVAKNHGGTKVALWSKQAAADSQLAQGMTKLYTDRDEADQFLQDAERNLKEVEAGAGNDPLLLERARFALGQTYESMSNVQMARKYYDLVAKTSPDSALGKVATKRFEVLSNPETEAWYEWFAEQKPKTPQINAPGGIGSSPLGADGRENLKNLPKSSDLPSLEKEFPSPSKVETKVPTPDDGTQSQETLPEEKPSKDATSNAPAADPTPDQPPADPAQAEKSGEGIETDATNDSDSPSNK